MYIDTVYIESVRRAVSRAEGVTTTATVVVVRDEIHTHRERV